MPSCINTLIWAFVVIFAPTGHGEEQPHTFQFPPFSRADLDPSVVNYSPGLTIPQLRAVLTSGLLGDQGQAALALIKAGDQKTLLRLVYAFKQGNPFVENLLFTEENLLLVPLLLEGVAHGSLDRYGDDVPRSDTVLRGQVRVVATKACIRTLAFAEELPDETRKWFQSVRSFDMPEASRLIVTWWLLNQEALDAGKWQEARTLPALPSIPKVTKEMLLGPKYLGPPIPQPPPRPRRENPWGPTWEVNESFEAWSARIVDPKKRDLRFADLTWNRGYEVHPLRNLLTEPMAPLPERSTPAPAITESSPDKPSSENEPPSSAPSGLTAPRLVALLAVVIGLGGIILCWAFQSRRH